MDHIKIGTFLKTLRKEKNLTQEQLAEKLGVSNSDCLGRCSRSCIWNMVSVFIDRTINGGMRMYKICMNCGKKYELSEKKCHNRKCPECGGKMKTQYSEEELEEIQKQNDDMVVINTLLM